MGCKANKLSVVRSDSKRAYALLLMSLCLGASSHVYAASYEGLPSAGEVMAGAASLDYEVAGELHIHQKTQKTVIDWQSFNIGEGRLAAFHQPNADAIAVNRVIGAGIDPTQILGRLTANGNIVVLDRNGVVFGSNAQVDVGGIVVSTGDINTTDFMNGEHIKLYDIGGDAEIVNNGRVSVGDAGLAAFVAPTVHNKGVITAKLGHVVLAAGDTATLDLYGDGLLELAIGEGDRQEIINEGLIHADGSIVQIRAAAARDIVDNLVVNTGVIVARGVTEGHDGKIILHAEGAHRTEAGGVSTVLNSGALDASTRGRDGQGGIVTILGDQIALLEGSIIDASGRQGGGNIMIGGDYLGGGTTPTATYNYVAPNTAIYNDAIDIGDGGRTIIWSDDYTAFYGQVYARGGDISGDGGFVETSGKNTLIAKGAVDLRAVNGAKGTYLLDPEDIIIYGDVDDTFTSGGGRADLSVDKVLKISPTSGRFDESGYLLGTDAPLNSFGGYSAVGNGDVDASASVIFSADIVIPETPSGVIYEQGGSGFGTYVGFQSDGTLVLHAGRGNSFSAADAAHIEIAPTDINMPTGAGVLSWKIDVSNNRITAYWNGVQIAEDSATQVFSKWSGGDTGGFGQRSNSIVVGANNADFNGSFNGDLKYYEYVQGFLNDLSGRGNNPAITAGSPTIVDNALNGHSVIRFADGDGFEVADTNDINLLSQSELTRSFTFSTDGDVSQEQLLYKEGGGTNGYVAYIENGKLNVGLYNSGGSPRAYHQYDVEANTDYHLLTTFDAAKNKLVTRLNGEVLSGAALGDGANLLAHSGDIVFGRNDTTIIDESNGRINPSYTVPTLAEAIFYNTALNDVEQQLMEQYAASKYNISMYGPGTGLNEAERAMASDGYSVFTVGYLEQLSQMADIALQANREITLDLRGATLSLADDRNISLQTINGDITDVSSGRIVTNRVETGGNVTMIAGGDINIDQLSLDTRNGGVVNMDAQGDVRFITTQNVNMGQVSGNNIFIETKGSSALSLHNTVSSRAAGNSLVLKSGQSFVNNHGADVLDAGAGRWLVYSSDPAENMLGGVAADFKRYNKSYTAYAPASVVESGNGFLYGIAPVVTVRANDAVREYGAENPAFTSSYSGLIDGDVAAYAWDGAAAYNAPDVDAGVGVGVIAPSLGSLSSDLGYQFTFANGALTINPATLTVAVDDVTRDEGIKNPELSAKITGFRLADNISTLDAAPVLFTDAVASSSAGVYDITASGAADSNYKFVYINGALTINAVNKGLDLPSTIQAAFKDPVHDPVPVGGSGLKNSGALSSPLVTQKRSMRVLGDSETSDDNRDDTLAAINPHGGDDNGGNKGVGCLVSEGRESCLVY